VLFLDLFSVLFLGSKLESVVFAELVPRLEALDPTLSPDGDTQGTKRSKCIVCDSTMRNAGVSPASGTTESRDLHSLLLPTPFPPGRAAPAAPTAVRRMN